MSQRAHDRRACRVRRRGHFLASVRRGIPECEPFPAPRAGWRLYQPSCARAARAAPPGEVRGVPKVHLQVELAEPAIAGEPGFLRRDERRTVMAVWYCERTMQALQFFGARVAAAGEIHRAAAGPEPAPVLPAGRHRFFRGGKWSRSPARSAKLTDEFQGGLLLAATQTDAAFALHFARRLPGNGRTRPCARRYRTGPSRKSEGPCPLGLGTVCQPIATACRVASAGRRAPGRSAGRDVGRERESPLPTESGERPSKAPSTGL